MKKNFSNAKFNSAHMIIYGFLAAILIGTLILMLPVCSASGQWTDFVTALFTATTSTCVTGLVVVPTYAYWSVVGKCVILILIQLGGLGIISIVTGVLIITGKRITLKERKLIQESYSLDTGKGIIRHIRKIFFITFLLEITGAVLYSIKFIPQFGIIKGALYSIFHSVSAFCNAGLDLIGENSFIPYQGDVLINLTTVLLIVSGGIGFIVWWDIGKIFNQVRKKEFPAGKVFERMSLHTKIVLASTLVLIVSGTILTMAFEYSNPNTIGELSFGKKILASLFQSVTLRTAGFCTIDQSGFRSASVIVFCMMMLIGGSPMGTAGGIKTTTVSLIFLEVKSVVRGKNHTEAFKRRINRDNVKTALAVFGIAVTVLVTAIIMLTFTENTSLIKISYEAFSAIGTVGISMNFTSSLSLAGKVIIIVLMFFGRVGPITIALALAKKKRIEQHVKDLPEKRIIIG